jgi:hypothetical protein
VGLLRRRHETLNERLMREAGLEAATVDTESTEPTPPHDRPPPHPVYPTWLDAQTRAERARPREWDALVTAEVPALAGDEASFATIPDGTLIVDEDEERDLRGLADAVERELEPPYRARAVRQGSTDRWAVSAVRTRVIAMKADGDEIELAMHEGEATATVDGFPSTRAFPQLARLGEQVGSDYAVRAERLDGDLWEVRASPL